MQVGEVLRVTLQPLDGGPPDAPEGFQAAVADNAVSLRWSAPATGPSPTGYMIEAGSAPDTANLLQLPLGAVTGFDASAPTGTYYVRVKSTNAYGAGAPTASVRIDAGCVAPPGPPLGLQGQIAGSSVTLSWQRGAGNVARYVLQAGSATGLSNIATLSLAPASTTFAAAATPGTYFVRVRAANSCGVGPPSTEVSLVVGSGSELPGPPGTPSVVVTGSTVSLSWTAPALGSAPTAYRLEAGTSPGLANAALVTLGATPAFSVSGVPPGTYYVRVRAMNPAGVGAAVGRRDGDGALNGPVHTPSPLNSGRMRPFRLISDQLDRPLQRAARLVHTPSSTESREDPAGGGRGTEFGR